MKDIRIFKVYYTPTNLVRGFWIGFMMTVLLIALGVYSVPGLVMIWAFTILATPAIMARNEAIRKWEKENFVDRM